VFDYRHFGASDGQPRQLIDIAGQLDDYRAAICFARSLRGVNAKRIALWGTSLSGGHVIAVLRYRPGRSAKQLTMPLLVCIGDQDTAASVNLAAQAARQAPCGELLRYPFGHFAAYIGTGFERIITDEVAFLRRHLLEPIPEGTLVAEGHAAG
jgi:hypothetical protein